MRMSTYAGMGRRGHAWDGSSRCRDPMLMVIDIVSAEPCMHTRASRRGQSCAKHIPVR